MKPRGKIFFSISIAILLVVFLHFLGWINPIENLFRKVIANGSALVYRSTIYFTQQSMKKSRGSVDVCIGHCGSRENVDYQKELELNKAKVRILEGENSLLREKLNFFASSEYSYVSADVIGRNIDLVDTTLVINVGSNYGVKINNPVIIGKGILIGKIARVTENNAVVRLIDDSQSKIAAMVMGMNKSIGLVEGGYGVSVRLSFVPQNEIIKPGDLVVSSGLEPDMPKGLGIGTIEVVEKKPQEPFQEAVLKALVELRNIDVVSVIIGSKILE